MNGCGLWNETHEKALRKHDLGREAIQGAVRIVAVIHAAAGVMDYEAGHSALARAA